MLRINQSTMRRVAVAVLLLVFRDTTALVSTLALVAEPRSKGRCTPRCIPLRRSVQIYSMESPDDFPGVPPAGTEDSSQSSAARMKDKLRNESRFPLKLPLLGVSAVIGGKGLTDALLTMAKVSAGMRGVSLSEEFMGVPVLAIDTACVAAGLTLGAWTWRTMM